MLILHLLLAVIIIFIIIVNIVTCHYCHQQHHHQWLGLGLYILQTLNTSVTGFFNLFQMSGQKYTRTNFEEDEASVAGTPTAGEFPASVMYKRGAGLFRGKRTLLECILVVILGIASLAIIVLAALLAVRDKQIEKLENKVSDVSITQTSKPPEQGTTKKPEVQNTGNFFFPVIHISNKEPSFSVGHWTKLQESSYIHSLLKKKRKKFAPW